MFEDLCHLFDEEKARQESESLENVSLDMWGSCRLTNVLSNIERSQRLKPLQIELLRQVLNVCSVADVIVFVYAGTALGVFRENGHMIPHDYDVDLATFEYHDESPHGALSNLANFCLNSDIAVSGIEGYIRKAVDSDISVEFSNSFNCCQWLFMKEGQVYERPFNGNGGKRAKFNFTPKGLHRAALQLTHLELDEIDALKRDLTSIHVDLFTFSPHSVKPEENFRVNWQKAGVYESLEKQFAKKDILPLKEFKFEGLQVLAPANLEGYLTAEYGYLGRDAMYDHNKQQYVKMPERFFAKLPDIFKKYI